MIFFVFFFWTMDMVGSLRKTLGMIPPILARVTLRWKNLASRKIPLSNEHAKYASGKSSSEIGDFPASADYQRVYHGTGDTHRDDSSPSEVVDPATVNPVFVVWCASPVSPVTLENHVLVRFYVMIVYIYIYIIWYLLWVGFHFLV